MSSRRDQIRKKSVELSEDMKGREIASHLYAEKVLDADDKERIRAETTTREQNEKLLEIVERGGPEAQEAFYKALKKTSPHLAERLDEGQSAGSPGLGVPCKYEIVGRRELCQELVDIVQDGNQQRLLILTAPPGVGKSAVTTKVSHMLLDLGFNVVYCSLREASSLAGAASSILEDLGIRKGSKPVRQLQQYFKQCMQKTVLVFDNAEDLLDDRNMKEFKKFLENITCHAAHVHTLVNTRIAIEGLRVALDTSRVKKIPLPPLDDEESMEFLMKHLALANHHASEAKELGKSCGGVPLLMQLAAAIIHEGTSISSLVKELCTFPELVWKTKNPDIELVYQDLEFFMKRLPPQIQDALHCVAVFPVSFSRDEARMLFPNHHDWQYESTMSRLHSHALVQKVTDSQKLSLHPLVQAFCKASHDQTSSKYGSAMKKFIPKYLDMLRELNFHFVSTDCKLAIDRYELNKDNIKHALKSAAKDQEMKVFGITILTEVVSFLAKVMPYEDFLPIYEGFYNVAKDMQLNKHLAACLTSIGFKQLCYHGKDSTTVARETLTKALAHWKKEGLPHQEELAHCLSKLGLCLVRDGETEEGVQKMAEAIIIRKQLVQARGGNMERMLLGGSYCDLGMALFIMEHYRAAVNVWCSYTLPWYNEILHNHPFTANVLGYVGDAHFKLQQFPRAVKFKRKSLEMLVESLLTENHPDIARAFYRLGDVLAEHPAHEMQVEALEMLEKAKRIQVKVHASPADVEKTQRRIKNLRDVNDLLGNCHISSH